MKTLKDIVVGEKISIDILREELREAAIKWIKRIEFRYIYDGMVISDNMKLDKEEKKESKMYFGTEYSPHDRITKKGKKTATPIFWIMHFFNLTEEDLK